jgi:hypothetical protein
LKVTFLYRRSSEMNSQYPRQDSNRSSTKYKSGALPLYQRIQKIYLKISSVSVKRVHFVSYSKKLSLKSLALCSICNKWSHKRCAEWGLTRAKLIRSFVGYLFLFSITQALIEMLAQGQILCFISPLSIFFFPFSVRHIVFLCLVLVQGGSNMTGTDLCVNKLHCAAALRPWESGATTSTLPPARVRTHSVLSGSC